MGNFNVEVTKGGKAILTRKVKGEKPKPPVESAAEPGVEVQSVSGELAPDPKPDRHPKAGE